MADIENKAENERERKEGPIECDSEIEKTIFDSDNDRKTGSKKVAGEREKAKKRKLDSENVSDQKMRKIECESAKLTESGSDVKMTVSDDDDDKERKRKTACEEAAEEGLWDEVIGHLNEGVCPAAGVIGQLANNLTPELSRRLSLSKLHCAVLECGLHIGQGLFRALMRHLTEPDKSDTIPGFLGFFADYFRDRHFGPELHDDWHFACKQLLKAQDYCSIWFTIKLLSWERRDDDRAATMVKIVLDTVIQGDEPHSEFFKVLKFLQPVNYLLVLLLDCLFKLETDQLHKLADALDRWRWWREKEDRSGLPYPDEIPGISVQAYSKLIEIPEFVSKALELLAIEVECERFKSLADACADPDEVLRCLLEKGPDWHEPLRWSFVEKLVDRCTGPHTVFRVLDYAISWCRLDFVQPMISQISINQFPFLYVLRTSLDNLHNLRMRGDIQMKGHRCTFSESMQMLYLFVHAGCSTVDRAAVRGTEVDTAGPVAGDAESEKQVSASAESEMQVSTSTESEMQVSTSAELPYENNTEASDDKTLAEAPDDNTFSEALDTLEAFDNMLPQLNSDLRDEQMVDVTELMIKSGALSHRKLVALSQSPFLHQRMMHQQSLNAVVEAASTPGSLQHLARLAASKAVGCGPGRSARIDKLPIPNLLKNKLRFKDVTKEIEDKIKERTKKMNTLN